MSLKQTSVLWFYEDLERGFPGFILTADGHYHEIEHIHHRVQTDCRWDISCIDGVSVERGNGDIVYVGDL